MTRSAANRERASATHLIAASVACAVVGCVPWALAEGIMAVLPGEEVRRWPLVATIYAAYGLLSLTAGLAAGFLAVSLRRRLFAPAGGDPASVLAAFLLPGMCLAWGVLLVVSYLNIHLLPGALHPVSLAADAVLLALTGGAFLAYSRWLLGRIHRGAVPARLGASIVWAGGILVVLLLAKLTVLGAVWSPVATGRITPLPVRTGTFRKPNFLIISIDTLRADHVSAYGYGRRTTPFIDTLAREGTVFLASKSQAPWTRPSVASLFTSLYPSSHGALTPMLPISAKATTLFERVKPLRYRTAVFSSNGNVSPVFGFGRGVDIFYESPSMDLLPESTLLYQTLVRLRLPAGALFRTAARLARAEGPDRSDRDLWTVRRFTEWVAELRGEPFIAYIHLLGAHAPYLPPAPYNRAFGAFPRHRASAYPPKDQGDVRSPALPLPDPIVREMIDRYDGLIRFSDAQVRTAVQALRQRGLLDDTLIIVTADHGESFWNHRVWGHGGSLYGEQVRVPLVLWAGNALRKRSHAIPHGAVTIPVATVDVMPTVLSLVGVRCEDCEGKSLTELPTRGRQDRPIYLEQYGKSSEYIYALKRGRFKLLYASFDGGRWNRWELYDLAVDPQERRNLLNRPPVPMAPLIREVKAFRAQALAKRGPSAPVDLTEHSQLREKLKALGYLD